MRTEKSVIIFCMIISFISSAAAQTMVVTDPGAYSYFTGLDKKIQEQLGFAQKIQDAELEIKRSLTGNKRIGYGINNSTILYEEFFQLRDRMSLDFKQNNQSSDKPTAIAKNLDIIFPPLKVKIPNDKNKNKAEAEINKKTYHQNTLKASIIFAEMILSSSKIRVLQITSLANDIDGTTQIKEAIDVNNRLILELLLESRNTNLLLANLIKSQAAKDYEGSSVADYSEDDNGDVEDLMRGQGNLGSAITKPLNRGGKFTGLAK